MKSTIVLVLAVLLGVFVASAASATTVGWDVFVLGDSATYTYVFTSSEAGDWITHFHVYAPLSPTLVQDWSAERGWQFTADPDLETGGADLCWYAPDPLADGLAYGQSIQVSMTVSSAYPTVENFIVPGCLGNWGYETYFFAGWGVLVSFPCVGVPEGSAPVPEPLSVIVLAAGCAVMGLKRR